MPPTVDTLIEAPDWAATNLEDLAEAAARATLRHLGLDPEDFEVSLLGCDDARIADLNAEFRSKPAPTNVLSWPSAERRAQAPGVQPAPPRPAHPGEVLELGDIAIAHGTCRAEADVAGVQFETHVTHLLVHGVLHLLGFDHIDDADAALMEAHESRILTDLGLPDPHFGAEAGCMVSMEEEK